jgi:hypothetical protein
VKTFDQGIAQLSALVGHGTATGHVVVDQAYAQRQHEDLAYKHPRGGGPKYLEAPLYAKANDYFELVAKEMLKVGVIPPLATAMENLASTIEYTAPVLWWDLRRSGHPFVDDNGIVVYDRSPLVHRLTEAELKAKGRLIPMPPQLIGWIWWHVMHRPHPAIWYEHRGLKV